MSTVSSFVATMLLTCVLNEVSAFVLTTHTQQQQHGRQQVASTRSFGLNAHEGAYSLPFPSSSGGGGGSDDDKQKQQQQQQQHDVFMSGFDDSSIVPQKLLVETNNKDAPSSSSNDVPSSILSSADYFALEAFSLGTLNASASRSKRLEQESITKKRFMFGNDLLQLRTQIAKHQTQLDKLQRNRRRSSETDEEMEQLRLKIRRLQLRDAEFVYGEMLDMAHKSKELGNNHDATIYLDEALDIRGCLPQFNLGGLWVGKYGDHGYEMINVTYTGDTLIARKVTGDKNVPKDEITFMADLKPNRGGEKLGPIQLSETASKQWGTKALERFPGKGQVAAEGYKNAKYMDGQLILVGEEYFSFAWIPIGYQIFFGRPSAELTLKMLKQSEASILKKGRQALMTNDIYSMRQYALKCLQVTDELMHWRHDDDDSSLMDDFDNDELHFQ